MIILINININSNTCKILYYHEIICDQIVLN
jgi:hypothetical protein